MSFSSQKFWQGLQFKSRNRSKLLASTYDDQIFLQYLKTGVNCDPEMIGNFIEHVYNGGEYSQVVAEMALKSDLCSEMLHRPLTDEGIIEIATKKNKSKYPVVDIITKYPRSSKSIHKFLDHSIVVNGEDLESADFNVTLNFDYFLKDESLENGESSRNFKPEMELLCEIIEVPKLGIYREAILKHPLVQAFVELKWKRFRPFALLSFCFYVFLSVFMTLYVMKVQLADCRVQLNLDIMAMAEEDNPMANDERQFWSLFTLMISRPELDKHDKLTTPCQELAIFQYVLIPVILLMIIVILVLEIMEMWLYGRRYWKHFGNILQWVYIIFGAVTVVPVNLVISREVLYVQYQLAAFGILAIWSLLLIQASKFKELARYVDMLSQVIRSFVGFILAFGCLFAGFILCALILFSNFPSTETLPRSILKILVAMAGGFSYEDNFYRDLQETKSSNNGVLSEKHVLLYPEAGHIFLAIFTVVCSMALMNLLVALAVVDVEVMLKTAEGIMMRRMINEIYHTEKVVYKISQLCSKTPVYLKLKSDCSVNASAPHGNVEKIIFPNLDAEDSVDKETLGSILNYVKTRSPQSQAGGHFITTV